MNEGRNDFRLPERKKEPDNKEAQETKKGEEGP